MIVRKRHDTHGDRVERLLSEQDALELDDEEVDKLLHIIKNTLKNLLRNCVITTRPERASQALRHDGSSDHLRKSSNAEDDIETFERKAKERKVAAGEDEGDCGGKGDCSSTRMFPLAYVSTCQSVRRGVTDT